jgi:hypothetical protein
MSMQINNTLILAKQSFANVKEDVIIFVEIMIKARDYLQVNKSLKCGRRVGFCPTRVARPIQSDGLDT